MNRTGRDWTEREARFVIGNDKFASIGAMITSDPVLGRYELKPRGVKKHADTYFDTAQGRLFSMRWSLRIRESDSATQMTLKIPRPSEGAARLDRREIENSGSEDLNETFETIIRILRDHQVISGGVAAIGAPGTSRAVAEALASASPQVRALFTIETVRRTWDAIKDEKATGEESKDGQIVAELALDDSVYRIPGTARDGTARDGTARQCRMEIELRARADDDVLTDLVKHLQGRFGVEEVHSSKFEHGMSLHRGRT